MPENKITVRRKEKIVRSGKKLKIMLVLTLVLVSVISIVSILKMFSDNSDFASANLEIAVNGKNKIIRVPKGGNLQTAINRAESGDIIELEAGAIYKGEIVLPKKNLTDFVTIQSSRAKELPENQRVSPSQAALMAKIVTTGEGKPAVSTEKSAHHYRFVGIEFAPSNKDYIYNLIFFGAPEKVAETAHHLEIDRSFIHSIPDGVTRRGVALNSAQTVIKNSYFQGFAYPGEETQGICGWTGTKEVKITNNYIEGGAENVMFGGSDPANAELIPQDIEISGNNFNKPAEWKGKNTLKCLFELKDAKRVQFVENYLENNWQGSAFRITVRNQEGNAPFSTVEDVLIKNNIIDGAGEAVNILGKDDTNSSQTMKNLNIINNLFLNIGTDGYEGSGYFFQISGGENILIANNTVFNQGNISTFHGDLPKNLSVRDNIVGHGNYGIHGFSDMNSAAAKKTFYNNVFVNNRGVGNGDSSFPSNNLWVSDYRALGFVNYSQNDFNIAPNSRLKGKGSDKSDIGCNLSKMPTDLIKKIAKN